MHPSRSNCLFALAHWRMSVRSGLLAVLLLCNEITAFAALPVPDTSLYLNATLIDGDPTSVREGMAILTEGGRIVAVKPSAEFSPTVGQRIVDLRGKFVIPGLINTHVHLATLAEPDVARAYLRRELFSGVTTVRDMAGDSRLLGELQREAQLDEIASPDVRFVAVFAGPSFFQDPRTHDAACGRVAGTVPWMQAITRDTDLRTAVAEARGTGASAIKIYADLDSGMVKAVVKEAHRQGMLVWAHAAVFPARPSDVVEAGVDAISHSCLLAYEASHPVPESFGLIFPVKPLAEIRSSREIDELMLRIKRLGSILDATSYAFDRQKSKICLDGVEDLLTQKAYRAGVSISTGTDDDPNWQDPYSALDSELHILVHGVGMSPGDVIRSATVIGARAAGLEASVGTISGGKLANFAVLEKNPLLDIDNVRSVDLIVKHGIEYRRGDYQPPGKSITDRIEGSCNSTIIEH